MATRNSPKPNPMLKDLEGLVGDWEMELSNAAFLPHPTDTVKGDFDLVPQKALFGFTPRVEIRGA